MYFHSEYAIIPKIECKKLVVVVTYNRMKFIDKWLRAYNNAEKYGTKIAVIHAFDGDKPHQEEMDNILKHKPDFYIPIFNSPLRDFSGLVMVCKNLVPLPKWDHLFWFTDDMLPMRRTFLRPFVEKLEKPNTGLVAQCYEPKTTTNSGGHIRTVAYATKRIITEKFEFPTYETFDPRCGHEFEFGKNHIMKQVQKLGYDVELAHSSPEADNYQHWTSFLDWMWDCHLLESWKEYWDIYEEQFKPIQRLENVSGKVETVLSQGECEKIILNQNKVSFLIQSLSSSSENLHICLTSIKNNFPANYFGEIIISINNQNQQLNDEKEEVIKNFKKENAIDISLLKLTGDFKQSIIKDQLVLMCKNAIYAILDDSIKILDGNWSHQLETFLSNEKSAILCHNDNATKIKIDNNTLILPTISDKLVFCKKSLLKELSASWENYDINFKFGIGNFVSYKKFMQWQEKHKNIIGKIPEENNVFDAIELKSGSFVVDKILTNGYTIQKIDTNLICDISNVIRNADKNETVFVNVNNIIEKEEACQEQVVS